MKGEGWREEKWGGEKVEGGMERRKEGRRKGEGWREQKSRGGRGRDEEKKRGEEDGGGIERRKEGGGRGRDREKKRGEGKVGGREQWCIQDLGGGGHGHLLLECWTIGWIIK